MKKKNNYSVPVLFSALSGLLFFSPFLLQTFKKDEEKYSPAEREFILWWCKVGKGIRILLWLFVLSMGLETWTGSLVFTFLTEASWYLLLAILGIGTLLILSEKSFQPIILQQTSSQRKQMLLAFFPWYGDRIWYSSKQFDKPYWREKEAQLRWYTIFLALIFFPSGWVAGVLGLLLLVRGALLGYGYDILSQDWKVWLHHLFRIYPEESFAYLIICIQQLLGKRGEKQELLDRYQASYAYLQSQRGKRMSFLLYLILFFIIGIWGWYVALWRKGLAIFWFVGRCILIKKAHLSVPKFPIIAEFTA